MTIIDRVFKVLLGPNGAGTDDLAGLSPEIRRRVERDMELRRIEWEFRADNGRFPTPTELWFISPPKFKDLGDDLEEEAV